MQETFSKLEELLAHLKEYLDNRIAYTKLSVAEKSSKIFANLVSIFVSVLILFFFVVFASIALAFALAKLTGEYYWGFLIVAGIYLLMGTIVWIAKEKLLRLPMMNALLKQFFKEESEDEED